MVRPTDWWILSLDKDPLPQDPYDLRLYSTLYHSFADQMTWSAAGRSG